MLVNVSEEDSMMCWYTIYSSCTTIKVYKNVNKRGAFLFTIFNFTKQVMYHFHYCFCHFILKS